jgi:branched-subunit amino acid ABC-type transport system permease component
VTPTQLLVSLLLLGLTVGSMYALFAVSLGIILNVTHIFHLAHGAVITVAAYLIYVLSGPGHWPLWLSLPVVMAAAAALGIGMEVGVYRPLRRSGAPSIALFLSSVGLLTVVEGLMGIIFGPGVVPLSFLPLRPVHIGGATLTTANAAMVLAWVFVVAVIVYVVRWPSGRFLRAVGDTPHVASLVGIDLDSSYILSFGLGSVLAVPATLLFAWYQGLTPDMGLQTLFIAAAAVVIGGRRGLLPGAISGILLGMIQALALLLLPSGWQNAVVFTVLLIMILVRPQGVFGQGLRW